MEGRSAADEFETSPELMKGCRHARPHGTDDQELAGQMDTLVMTGWTEMLHGRYDPALRRLRRGLEVSRRTGQSLVLADLFAASATPTCGSDAWTRRRPTPTTRWRRRHSSAAASRARWPRW
ncbi:hypothetical protein [Streptomyces sp. NBC_00576]|uniref:hypothetical protein n=1 Tax=Streptomyces sp. NBC_00576 TaxID=2903665 RepID=UPI002E81866F|nr:hypothetical protein [Streptomyces sp. NBC_00576]WUB74658.1 hypothetical protein OG734_33970 [Streptomyces sp. NBC_00576]